MPVRLHEKILDCEEPVVGLDYITELLPESDPEVHFLYTFERYERYKKSNWIFIDQCPDGATVHLRAVWKHWTRQWHVHPPHGGHPQVHLLFLSHVGHSGKKVFFRHAFLEKMGEYFHKRETKAMMKRVRVYAENKMRLADKIKTVHCDASYPWPAGKAPWSLEMGGDGIPPPAKHTQTSSRVRTATVTSTPEPATLLPAPGNLQRPKTAEEAQEMLDTAMLMMQKVADFAKKENKVSEQEATVLKQTFNLGSNSSF